jgi:hypothetical protein
MFDGRTEAGTITGELQVDGRITTVYGTDGTTTVITAVGGTETIYESGTYDGTFSYEMTTNPGVISINSFDGTSGMISVGTITGEFHSYGTTTTDGTVTVGAGGGETTTVYVTVMW